MSDAVIACDLYRNPYLTRCSGSISPDPQPEATLSVCHRHMAASRDEWYEKATRMTTALQAIRTLANPDVEGTPQGVARYLVEVLAQIRSRAGEGLG